MAPGRGFCEQGQCNAGWVMFLYPSFLREGSQPWCLADFYKCCLCLMLMKASQLSPSPVFGHQIMLRVKYQAKQFSHLPCLLHIPLMRQITIGKIKLGGFWAMHTDSIPSPAKPITLPTPEIFAEIVSPTIQPA